MLKNYYESFICLSDNRKLSYVGYGETNENTVIFLHGFGSSASAVHPDPTLLDKYNIRFFAINRPGYGGSDIKEGYTMEDFADSIHEFLAAKEIQRAAIIGWSAGGLYAQVFTDKYFENVSSLNLVSSAIPLNSEETKSILPSNWKMIRNMNKYIPFVTKMFFKSFSKKLSKDLDGAIQESVKQMVEEDKKIATDPDMKKVVTKGAVEGYQHDGIAVFHDAQALCNKYKDNGNPASNVKVNIWQGGADTVWTEETSNYLRAKYPNCKYSFVEKEGHLLYLSQWDNILKWSVGK